MSEIGQRIIAGIRKLAEEQPDFRYQPPDGDTCVYIHNGEGSCGVGRVLLDLGLITADLERDRTRIKGASVNACLAHDLLSHLDVAVDPHEARWIVNFQFDQDDARPWGRAVETADQGAVS